MAADRLGLMGVVADAVLQAGGEVIGVLPHGLASKELLHPGVTQMHLTPDMHTRKALMNELSDGFIALPGGLGTFEELFEVITWAQLGIHHKPIGLLNTADFFAPLLSLIDHAVTEGFVQPALRRLVVVAETPKEMLSALRNYDPPPVRVWLTAPEN